MRKRFVSAPAAGLARIRQSKLLIRGSAVALLLVVATLFGAVISEAQDFTTQPSPTLASIGVPAALANQLDPQGSELMRTSNRGSQPICNVWWVKAVPTVKPAATAPDVLFNNVQTGTLVGLLQFLSPDAEDFRDQKLKPGLYTMRYAQIPANANHMGVSQYRDFVLLIPQSADTQPDKILNYDDLVALSRKAAGTNHPAVMSLVAPNPAYKKLPAVVADNQGNASLQVNLQEKSPSGIEEAKLALLLVTAPKDEGGS
jgi:hypothetical protein